MSDAGGSGGWSAERSSWVGSVMNRWKFGWKFEEYF
jgi:hypothetical protein